MTISPAEDALVREALAALLEGVTAHAVGATAARCAAFERAARLAAARHVLLHGPSAPLATAVRLTCALDAAHGVLRAVVTMAPQRCQDGRCECAFCGAADGAPHPPHCLVARARALLGGSPDGC